MEFLRLYEKLTRATEGILESYRRGDDYLIQRKWLLSAFKWLFDIADHCNVGVDDDVASMLRQREKKNQRN